MTNNVVPFPRSSPLVTPIGQFIRLGDDGAQALGDLISAGHLCPDRIVIDASRMHRQREQIRALRATGAEIVLDTKVAELGTLAKHRGFAGYVPWAKTEGTLLGPEHFGRGAKTDVIDAIARFAVSNQTDAVLAPTHWLGDTACDDWFERDLHSCTALRAALDREGGKGIAIDYSLLVPHTLLQEASDRAHYLERLRDVPFENLWIRASGFRNNAASLTTSRHIEALTGLHGIDRPIVADYVGGITGNALLAFGAASAVAHGIGKLEGFDAKMWHKPARARGDDDGGPRSQRRVSLPDINRSLTCREVTWLAEAKGGRKHLACGDRTCCPGGLDMLRDPRRHAVRQTAKQVEDLARVPDLKRPEHLMNQQLGQILRRVRSIAKLKPDAGADHGKKVESLMKRLTVHGDTLEKTGLALSTLQERQDLESSRAKPVRERQAQKSLFEKQGRR